MNERIAVLIVEDHVLLAQGLALSLEREGYDVAVAAADDLRDVSALLARVQPKLVLLDLDLGVGRPDGRMLIAELRASGADVVVLSGVADPIELGRCVQAGAVGVIAKSESFPAVLQKMSAALGGQWPRSGPDRDELLAGLREHEVAQKRRLEPFERLTARESAVLASLVEGLSVREIAEQSTVSPATVRSQIHAVLEKLGVHSQLAAAAMARRSGWVPG